MPEEFITPHNGISKSHIDCLPGAEDPGSEFVADALRVDFPARRHLSDETFVVVVDYCLKSLALMYSWLMPPVVVIPCCNKVLPVATTSL